MGKMAEQNKALIQKPQNKGQTEEEKEEAKARAEQLMKQGGEINVLDAKPIEIDSEEMSKYCRVWAKWWKPYLSLPVWNQLIDTNSNGSAILTLC